MSIAPDDTLWLRVELEDDYYVLAGAEELVLSGKVSKPLEV